MANLVEKVSDAVKSLGVKAAYGEVTTIDGVEVLPVSVVWFGFGAGGDENENGGGGGGGVAAPVGAYINGEAGPEFRPNLIALLWILIPLTWVGGKALTSVIKALKK